MQCSVQHGEKRQRERDREIVSEMTSNKSEVTESTAERKDEASHAYQVR